jgi:DNA polymerase III epsilon subunit family exonuclease
MNQDILNEQLDRVTLVACDLETTGLSVRLGDEIVEIGAVKFCGDRVVDEFQTLVNPMRAIHPAASAVNGIHDAMLRDKPLIRDALPQLFAFAGSAPLVFHNAGFDMPFITHKAAVLGLPQPGNVIFDTLALSRALHAGRGKHNLAAVVERLGVNVSPAHRALSDARATAAVFHGFMLPYMRNGGFTVKQALDLQSGPAQQSAPETPEPARPASPMEQALLHAAAHGGSVDIEYLTASGSASRRSIRPLQLSRRGGTTYVIADCLLRGEQRTFRVDRISNCTAGDADPAEKD